MRIVAVTAGFLALLSACWEDDERLLSQPDGAVDVTSGDAGVSSALTEQDMLDVLFVIDNSGSMASKQQKLAREIPRMVAVLTSGDRYATRENQVPSDVTDKVRHFVPVRSLHLGVVSTNFGGIDQVPPNQSSAVQSCIGLGDGGKLQNSVDIAVQGLIAQNDREFDGYKTGDVVLGPDPTCALPPQPRYQDFESGDEQALTHAFSCTARLGVRGCPFEQPLESMWAAVAPSSGTGAQYTFALGSRGQGDTVNAGFLRPNAALAVMLLTDEDDCSVTDAGRVLFSLDADADEQYGPISLRCGHNNDRPELVYAVERYAQGLLALKPGHAERVVFSAIAGVPLNARNSSFDALLALPEMKFREQLDANGRSTGMLTPVCVSATGDEAYPANRLLLAAKQFPNAVVESICADDYAPAIDALVDKVAPLMGAY